MMRQLSGFLNPHTAFCRISIGIGFRLILMGEMKN